MIFEINEIFELNDDFIRKYIGKNPDWGPVGYLVYKRTYARDLEEGGSEEWWQTVRRVVEGCYTIQLNHCLKNLLPWDDIKAQRSAQEMFRKIWDFKFLPPGRGLWAMGTDIIPLKGSAPLNNCAFVSTKDIDITFSDPFSFLMDMSMMGVGVAFDTLGANKFSFKEPRTIDTLYTVDDSKEGWCELIRDVLDSYVGLSQLPVNIDYSRIRPAGAPIKTFGGIAPGPEPLKRCVAEITTLLNDKIGRLITSTDIVDLMNIIGKCVVSGGVRRTAELALGSYDDIEYLKLKDPVCAGDKLMSWRWASNNSVICDVGMDYVDIGKQTAVNGEPGYFWLENARAYGRLADGIDNKDRRVMGTNPCVTGDTLIAVADGRGSVRIDELEDGTPIYCIDDDNNIAIRKAMHPRITGYNVPIYKMILDDGMEIKCTDNHKFRMKTGEYVQLKNLKVGDSLNVLTKYIPDERSDSYGDQYISYSWGSDTTFEHSKIAEFLFGKKSNNQHVHHKDGNKLNNRFSNLEYKSSYDHMKEHTTGINNPNYSGFSNDDLIEIGISLCKKLGRRFSNEEWKELAIKEGYPIQICSEYRNEIGRSCSDFSKKCAILSELELDPNLDTRTQRKYIELTRSGYDCEIIDRHIHVIKNCEVCDNKFKIGFESREQCVCSTSCSNKIRDYSKNKEGQKRAFGERRNTNRELQANVYLSLQFELKKEPTKKEWVDKCNLSGISPEISRMSSPFKSWNELKEYSSSYNHRVVSIEFLGNSDVWNCTVEDFHNFFIGGQNGLTPAGRNKSCYINSLQCGEQSLESYEICNLVETFPSRHKDFHEYKNTLKYAYLYAKTVTLVPTHIERTNSIVLRNRRIGLSQSGIVESFERHGRRDHFNWCDEGYKYITRLDDKYADWLCVSKSIKKTSVKPSGTVSLLPGVTPGIHYAHSKYYFRTIRLDKNSPLLKVMIDANYRIEKSLAGDDTMIVYFPICENYFDRSKNEVTIWEQLENLAMMQYYWADNQVSATITFNENESKDIPRALEIFETRLKSASFLPLYDHNYPQAPYQTISEEEYNEAIKNLKPLDFSNIGSTNDTIDTLCDGDSCVLTK